MSTISISSIEDLRLLLSKHKINPALWKGVSVEELYQDIKKGECVFKEIEGKLLRKVRVVTVHCFHTNNNHERLKLIEEKQVFIKEGLTWIRKKDGKIFDFVSETMKPHETPEEAAIRALWEELQITDGELRFEAMPELFENRVYESLSYLGIQTDYKIYHFKTEIPEHLYKPHYVEITRTKATHFSWIKVEK